MNLQRKKACVKVVKTYKKCGAKEEKEMHDNNCREYTETLYQKRDAVDNMARRMFKNKHNIPTVLECYLDSM